MREEGVNTRIKPPDLSLHCVTCFMLSCVVCFGSTVRVSPVTVSPRCCAQSVASDSYKSEIYPSAPAAYAHANHLISTPFSNIFSFRFFN